MFWLFFEGHDLKGKYRDSAALTHQASTASTHMSRYENFNIERILVSILDRQLSSKRNCFDDIDLQFVTTWGGNNDSLAQVALQASRPQIVTQSKCEQTERTRKDSCMQESK
ncbi:hypothetical protein FOIG_11978 [Fusarium odoratissimum NRRL 54006]|uniref:Uncharacterized protein n=2 Tax=Fusarium oxysporum species complex TaxID=171631 RepID=X0JGM0_FUSO5|nr:uncharacterized protein FOIG_11978 [Fusarium odoratissimum NRRL 54006]EXL95470.1 hypothetical protein FOIG_11978 [Fusarium odoratissimum NRRL 54006]TXC06379.1 hypothetical protein FocTR4_00010591 [Fusarium oxysporum f. sp. cubense]